VVDSHSAPDQILHGRGGARRLQALEPAIIVPILPIATEEVQVLLVEPKTTVNTGSVKNDRTVEQLDWI